MIRKLVFALLCGQSICSAGISFAGESSRYLLQAAREQDSSTQVSVRLEVGGELLVADEDEQKRLPMKVAGKAQYTEQIVAWSPQARSPVRSLRKYDHAEAAIQVDQRQSTRKLPGNVSVMLAEIRGGVNSFTPVERKFTREQFDLVNMVGNSLVLDQLLPGRKLAEGDDWEHKPASIAALLCMDHISVCEVTSVVTGEKHRQVQLRMAGTVHGTVDGADAEMELRAAYLFHLDEKRITKFNLAIKEERTPGEIAPGLDVVAKANVSISSTDKQVEVPQAAQAIAQETSRPLPRTLVYESSKEQYRFSHDAAWYVTAEQRDQVSLRYLRDGALTAHCNLTTLPARSAGRHTSLEQFERDIRKTLEKYLKEVTAATEWETAAGHHCLGIIAQGTVKDVPVEWRYYLVSDDDLPRVSVAITLEQSQVEAFADVDRQIIDSMKLLSTPATAAKDETKQTATK